MIVSEETVNERIDWKFIDYLYDILLTQYGDKEYLFSIGVLMENRGYQTPVATYNNKGKIIHATTIGACLTGRTISKNLRENKRVLYCIVIENQYEVDRDDDRDQMWDFYQKVKQKTIHVGYHTFSRGILIRKK